MLRFISKWFKITKNLKGKVFKSPWSVLSSAIPSTISWNPLMTSATEKREIFGCLFHCFQWIFELYYTLVGASAHHVHRVNPLFLCLTRTWDPRVQRLLPILLSSLQRKAGHSTCGRPVFLSLAVTEYSGESNLREKEFTPLTVKVHCDRDTKAARAWSKRSHHIRTLEARSHKWLSLLFSSLFSFSSSGSQPN